MAQRGFFRRIADAARSFVERFTEPEEPAQPKPQRRRRIRRAPKVPDYTQPPSRRERRKMPTPPAIGDEWEGEWQEIDLGLIDEVISDLLADLDAAGYL